MTASQRGVIYITLEEYTVNIDIRNIDQSDSVFQSTHAITEEVKSTSSRSDFPESFNRKLDIQKCKVSLIFRKSTTLSFTGSRKPDRIQKTWDRIIAKTEKSNWESPIIDFESRTSVLLDHTIFFLQKLTKSCTTIHNHPNPQGNIQVQVVRIPDQRSNSRV